MAQRDYEVQPEAPDLGASVQLDTAESLTGPAGAVDPLDAGWVPPDRPYALDDDGVHESLEERLDRELPEEEPADPDRSGRIAMADDGADDMVGVDVGVDGGGASAEEAAMHDVDAGVEPVEDDGPAEDAGVSAQLADDPLADRAAADAARDAADIDARPEAGGAAAPASGRDDVGPGSGI